MTTQPQPSDAAIAEKEKTKRTLITTAAIVIVGVTALVLFFQNIDDREGRIEIDQTGVKIDLGKAITTSAQVPTNTATPFGTNVEVTTAPIESKDIPEQAAKGTEFVGRNLVDTASGFVMSAEHPEDFTVVPGGTGGKSEIKATDGSRIVIERVAGGSAATFTSTVNNVVRELRDRGLTVKVQNESPTTTLLWYREGGKQYCVKVAASQTSLIRATAMIADSTKSASILQSLGSVTAISGSTLKRLPAGSVEGGNTRQRR